MVNFFRCAKNKLNNNNNNDQKTYSEFLCVMVFCVQLDTIFLQTSCPDVLPRCHLLVHFTRTPSFFYLCPNLQVLFGSRCGYMLVCLFVCFYIYLTAPLHWTTPPVSTTRSTGSMPPRITECYSCFYYASDSSFVQALLDDMSGNDESCVRSPSTVHHRACPTVGASCGILKAHGSASYLGKLHFRGTRIASAIGNLHFSLGSEVSL